MSGWEFYINTKHWGLPLYFNFWKTDKFYEWDLALFCFGVNYFKLVIGEDGE